MKEPKKPVKIRAKESQKEKFIKYAKANVSDDASDLFNKAFERLTRPAKPRSD